MGGLKRDSAERLRRWGERGGARPGQAQDACRERTSRPRYLESQGAPDVGL